MLRRARVTLRVLWIEELSRELYACDPDGLPPRLMGDEELAATFAAFDEASA